MDIVQLFLSTLPVPYLSTAFSLLRCIYSSVEQVQASKKQLRALSETAAHLLITLDNQCLAGKLSEIHAAGPLGELCKLLEDILDFVQTERAQPFLKLMFTKQERVENIEDFHRRIANLVQAFQISSFVNIQDWQSRNDAAREDDQRLLCERLEELQSNQMQLFDVLQANQNNMIAMMVSLQRHLENHLVDDGERQFYSQTLRYLYSASGNQVELESWMVTSYEVDFGPKIGGGGFGDVYRGTWNKTEVALKVIRTEGGVTPSSASIRHEVKIWSSLRHPNVLPFLGANPFGDRPFIIMPYMPNGNARDFLRKYPNHSKLSVLRHVSLGLLYLHSRNVVHGDLKALNILIDNAGTAMLCDFGLSRVKADVTSRAAFGDVDVGAGSRNWMSPERLLGGVPKKPSDIYAFGMTIYEISADQVPLGHILESFRQLVVNEDVRPEQRGEDDIPVMSDGVWRLAEMCWAKDPSKRPTASVVCDVISRLVEVAPIGPSGRQVQISHHPNWQPSLPLSHDLATRPAYYPTRPAKPPSLLLRKLLTGHSSAIFSVAFSPDGNRIASGCRDGIICVWDIETGKTMLNPLKGHTRDVYSISFSPDGHRVVSGSEDATIRIWDATTGRTVFGPFSEHTGRVWSVAYSPNGKQIASGSSDKTVMIRSAETGKAIRDAFMRHSGAVRSVAFSPNGSRIVSGSWDRTLIVWDVQTGLPVLEPLRGHTAELTSVDYSPDGTRIVSGCWDNTVRIWDAESGSCILGPLDAQSHLIQTVSYSPDGWWIISGACGEAMRLWDALTGEIVGGPVLETRGVNTVAFSPDGKMVAAGLKDKIIHLYSFL